MNTVYSLFEYTDHSGRKKSITAYCGDICDITDNVDVLICSAFKHTYSPTPKSLLGSLWNKKGISVHYLSQTPELDLRTLGGWVSKETTGNFKRIACIELIDWRDRENFPLQRSTTLATAFATMRFLLEQTHNRGITVRKVVLPLLGSGRQNIEPCYTAVPLLKECISALDHINELQEIIFCDINQDRILQLKQAINKITTSTVRSAPVFISYSTLDLPHAQTIRSLLVQRGIDCWMAPESIPIGSSYLEEIPLALNEASAVALVLSSNAEYSSWVPKELGVAISRKCPIFPFQISDYVIGPSFKFLLEGCQIFQEWNIPHNLRYNRYVDKLFMQPRL